MGLKGYVRARYGQAVEHDLEKAIAALSPAQHEVLDQFPIRISKEANFLSFDFPAKELVLRAAAFEIRDDALRAEMLGRLFLQHPIERIRIQQFLISKQGEPPVNETLRRKKFALLCEGPALLADVVRLSDLKSSDPQIFEKMILQAEALFGQALSPLAFFDQAFASGNDSFIHRRRIALTFLQKSDLFGEAALGQNPEVDATFGIFITDIQRQFGTLLGKKATIDPLGYLADRIQQRGRVTGIVPILEEAKILIRSGTSIDPDNEPSSLSEWLIYRHNIDELRGLKALGEDEEIEFLEAIDEALREKAKLFAPRRRTFERLIEILARTEISSLASNLNLFLSETQDLGLIMVPERGNAMKLRIISKKMQQVGAALQHSGDREAKIDAALKSENVVEDVSTRAQRHAAIRQIVRSLRLPGFSWIDWVRAMETIGGDTQDASGQRPTISAHTDQIPPLDPREWTSYLITRVHNPNFKGMNPSDAELLFEIMTGLIPLSAISDGIFDYAPGWANDQEVRSTQSEGKTVSLSHLIRSALFQNRVDLAEATLILALESIRDHDVIGVGLFEWAPDDLKGFQVFGLGHSESTAWLHNARVQAAQSLLALENSQILIDKAPAVIEVLKEAKKQLCTLIENNLKG